MAKDQTLELDCRPGTPRPGDLIAGVIKGTGLDKRETVFRFFGSWVWDYSDIAEEKWLQIQPIIEERIKKMYKNGLIRYGSW